MPTPRSPTIRVLLLGRPRRTRSMTMWTLSRSSSRPASSGGGVPAPGVNGFVIGSMARIIQSLADLSTHPKLPNIPLNCSAPSPSFGATHSKPWIPGEPRTLCSPRTRYSPLATAVPLLRLKPHPLRLDALARRHCPRILALAGLHQVRILPRLAVLFPAVRHRHGRVVLRFIRGEHLGVQDVALAEPHQHVPRLLVADEVHLRPHVRRLAVLPDLAIGGHPLVLGAGLPRLAAV